jgi:hypothetical protein
MENERYSLEKAQEEANRLRTKIGKETADYNEAEKLVDVENEKNKEFWKKYEHWFQVEQEFLQDFVQSF